ncbi:MAG: hypothetical protein HC779_02750 [Phyllobacteriaceae bacterium]|nr:hypothetical protein [Phyllobacteriaceae bacterium]
MLRLCAAGSDGLLRRDRVSGDAQLIAVQLWTLVHGAASLTIDGDYAKASPDIDVRAMIENGALRLLFNLPAG